MSILGVGFGNINWGLPFKAPSPVKNKTTLILSMVILGGLAGLLGTAFYRRRRVQYGQQLPDQAVTQKVINQLITPPSLVQAQKANEAITKWFETDQSLRRQGLMTRPPDFIRLCNQLTCWQIEISTILKEATGIPNERLDQINKIITRLSMLQPYFELGVPSWQIEGSGYRMTLKIPIERQPVYLPLSRENEKQLTQIVTTFEQAHHWNYSPIPAEFKRLREGVPFVAEWLTKAKEKHSTSVFP